VLAQSQDDAMIDRCGLADLLTRERATVVDRTPRSRQAYEDSTHLFGRVPMTWMNKRAGGFPLYLATARGAHVTDLDGRSYVDYCLGDTGAMAGH
jgi:glutamate-1-semialdehyde 2,1-aminomutase